MKSEDINQARDAIAQRDGKDSSYYYDGGFRYLANNEYVVKSLNPFFGWEAMMNECDQLRKERDKALNDLKNLTEIINQKAHQFDESLKASIRSEIDLNTSKYDEMVRERNISRAEPDHAGMP